MTEKNPLFPNDDIENVNGKLVLVKKHPVTGGQTRSEVGVYDRKAAQRQFIDSSQNDNLPSYVWDPVSEKMVPVNKAARREEAKNK